MASEHSEVWDESGRITMPDRGNVKQHLNPWRCRRCQRPLVAMSEGRYMVIVGEIDGTKDDIGDFTVFAAGNWQSTALCGGCHEAFMGFLAGAKLTFSRDMPVAIGERKEAVG